MRRPTFLAVVCLILGFIAHPAAAEKPPGNGACAANLEALSQEAEALYQTYPENPAALDRGIALYRKILEEDPQNAEAQWRIAENLGLKTELAKGKNGRFEILEQCLEEAEKAASLDPGSPQARFYMGISLAGMAEEGSMFKALGRVKRAKKELHRAVELSPKGPFGILARSVLAQIEVDSPKGFQDLDVADTLSLEAVGLDPNLTYAWLVRGQVLAEREKNGEALKALETCLTLESPTYPPDARALDWPRARDLKARLLAGENP